MTTFFLLGKVRSGFWPKAVFIVVVKYFNEDPELCCTEEGVTELKSSFTTITIKTDNDEITSYCNCTDIFSPINNWEASSKRLAVI